MIHALAFSLLLTPPTAATPPVPMVGGEETSGHAAVGALVVCNGESCASFCSGTLVASHWVLTAGHCVEAMLYDYGVNEVSFAVGDDVRYSDGRNGIAPTIEGALHPRYDEDLEHDIGLVRLGSPLGQIATQPLVSTPPDQGWLGTELRYVGFGVTAEDAADSGVKRQADIPLDDYDEQWLMAFDPEEQVNLCWGDSGGAALLPLEDGTYAQVGVQSWVDDDDDTPCVGGSSGATRVDAHLPWIRQQVDVVEIEVEEPEVDDEEPGEDTGEGEDGEDDGETGEGQDDEGQGGEDRTSQDDEDEQAGSGTIPSNDPTLNTGEGNSTANFGRVATGCSTAPGGAGSALTTLLAFFASLMLVRRRP